MSATKSAKIEKMKPERLQSAGESVVDREQRRDERAIRLIARERAEGRRVAEEERNVPQLANGRVVYDRVRVVEVEAVVKMVCVGREEGDQQQRTAQTREGFPRASFALASDIEPVCRNRPRGRNHAHLTPLHAL